MDRDESMASRRSAPATGELLYGIEDDPGGWKAPAFAAQHILTMFGATVSVPLILAPALGLDAEQLARLISGVLVISGIATFLQARFGTRLPIVQGVSFSFVGPFFVIIAGTAGGEESLQYIGGALICGALVEMAVGYSGVMGRLRPFLSPVVIGPVIMLIGLSLFNVAAPQAGGNWWLAGYVVVAVLAFSLFLGTKSRWLSIFPVLLAVGSAYLLAVLFSALDVIPAGDPGHVSFSAVSESPWVRNPFDMVLPWGAPKFDLGFFLAVLAGYLASMIESFGQYHAAARASGLDEPTKEQVNRGIGAKGIGSLTSGLMGGVGTTSYAENIGLVALTRVASRAVVLLAAGGLVFLGLFSKTGAVLSTLPSPLLGGMYLVLFGLIAGIGLNLAARADLSSQRNLFIMGFCLFLGLSLPAYFQNTEVTISGAQWLGDMIKSIGSAGMAVAAIAGLILDNTIPGTDEERGLSSLG